MGRDAGHIAISAGIAGGADVILIPEIPYTMTLSAAKSKNARTRQSYSLVIASEAVRTETGEQVTRSVGQCRYGGIGQYLADEICTRSGAETRVTVWAYPTRGTPSPLERLMRLLWGGGSRFDRRGVNTTGW